MWLFLLCLVLCVSLIRIYWVILKHKKRKSRSLCQPFSILLVLGSGGHTTELLLLLDRIDVLKCQISCFLATSDHTSRQKTLDYFGSKWDMSQLERRLNFITIPRSREVGQSYASTIFSTIWAFFHCLISIIHVTPELILCNGPGTCVPVCYGTRLLEVLGFLPIPVRIIFIESFCRVNSLSLSGKLLLPIVDELIVQWNQLRVKYPSTKYIGRIL